MVESPFDARTFIPVAADALVAPAAVSMPARIEKLQP